MLRYKEVFFGYLGFHKKMSVNDNTFLSRMVFLTLTALSALFPHNSFAQPTPLPHVSLFK